MNKIHYSKRARRIYFDKHLKPIDMCMELLTRITKYNALPYPECDAILDKIVLKFSNEKNRTKMALLKNLKRYVFFFEEIKLEKFYIYQGKTYLSDSDLSFIEFSNFEYENNIKIKQMINDAILKSRENKTCCELCGEWKNKKTVQTRSVYGWDTEKAFDHSKTILCVPCWNKVKPIYKAKKEANEIKLLTGRLNRSIQKWQKSQQQVS